MQRTGLGNHHTDSLSRAVTAQDGTYRFKFADTWDCDWTDLFPEKPGYKSLDSLTLPNMVVVPGARVPDYAYLVKEGDEPRLLLEAWLQSSKGVRQTPGPFQLQDYLTVFMPFDESKKIATTPEQIAWVRLHYCGRLSDLYALIPQAERPQLTLSSYKADYETLVRPYCQAPAEAPSSPADVAPG